MPQRVNLPDGRIINFPDGMSTADISTAVEGILGEQSAPAAEPKQERSVGGFLGNLVSSGGRFVKDTAEGLGAMAGVASKLPQALTDPKLAAEMGGQIVEGVKSAPRMVRALGSAIGNRYGGLEQIKETAYTDPVGVLADVSTLTGLGAVGTATRAPKIASVLRKVEAATNPLSAVAKPAAAAGGRAQNVAVSAYERMLKPNKSTLEGMPRMGGSLQERSRRVAEELIRDPDGQISKSGAVRFKDATSKIQGQVDEIVDANPEARGSTDHLRRELAGSRGRFEQQWAPSGDTSAFDAVADEVMNNPRITKAKRSAVDTSVEHALGMAPSPTEVKVTGREMIPRIRATTARGLTQGTYRNLGDKAYGELKGAATEAQKAAARGGRSILNEALPQVEPLNNQIAKRIDLGEVLDEAVLRSGKHDPIGLSQQVVLSGSNPGWLLASLINRPGVGSPIARGVYRAGGALQVPATAELMRAALLARLLGQDQ